MRQHKIPCVDALLIIRTGRVFGTEDLIVSFDVVNIQWPNRKDAPANKPWAHQDQDPERPGFRCLQGLVNLNESGPDDGGLILMRGGHKISEEYHNTFRDEERIWWVSFALDRIISR